MFPLATYGVVRATVLSSWLQISVRVPASTFILQESDRQGNVYNILWAVVFGFATINILSLVAKRLEPSRTRMNFGEALAIMVVVISVVLLGWEMLYFFHVLPIKLEPR
jgi:hypothetical protein